MNLQIIFFFYGLAFIIMGISILVNPNKEDVLKLNKDLWLISLFGLVHGLNEWIDLLILRGGPFNPEVLKIFASPMLPISYVFLIIFGIRTIFVNNKELKYLKHAWLLLFLIWVVVYLISRDFLISQIFARYFICIPGTFIAAASLFVSIVRVGRNNVPKIVLSSVLMAAVTFMFYGILSGLIVPKANVLFSPFINDQNFSTITGFSVQFFRMICAIILAISFFGITAVFSLKGDKQLFFRGGIKRKVVFLTSGITIIAVSLSLGFIYVLVYNLMRYEAGKRQMELALTLSKSVSEMINNELRHSEVQLNSRVLWRKAIELANHRYDSMQPSQINDYMIEMDKKWINATPEDPLVKEYLDNDLGKSLQALADRDNKIAEIFLTDKYGGLVSSSGKTSDFYQADEDWWQKACAVGSGSVYIGDVELDVSSGIMSLTFAIPLKDESNQVLGICKESINVERFLEPIRDLEIGATGNTSLVNGKGSFIFTRDAHPLEKGFASEKEMQQIIKRGRGWYIDKDKLNQEREILTAYAGIKNSLFERNKIDWYVFVTQDTSEMLAPLKKLRDLIIIVLLLVLLITLPIGRIFADKLAKPIQMLNSATEGIIKGNWDINLKIDTRDEIEHFAETFGTMLSQLRNQQKSLLQANLEIENFSQDLEKKVAERTLELIRAKEATLNILEDLTEEKDKVDKYALELEKAVKIKSDFTSMVSHELRTPLTAIKEGIAIVLDESTGSLNEEQKDFLSLAKRNVDRLARLINDVLDFQKLESGRMVFEIKEDDLNEVIKEVWGNMRPITEKKGLDLVLNLSDNIPKVNFDRDKIIQVLTNLVNNAIKFTDKGGIVMSTLLMGNTVEVLVKDSGIGIKEEDMHKLFKQFSQLDTGTERKTGSTGLGLAISKEIIEQHRGKIWVESKFGEGTTFHFILPLKERRA